MKVLGPWIPGVRDFWDIIDLPYSLKPVIRGDRIMQKGSRLNGSMF
jgi:hypothetical protein